MAQSNQGDAVMLAQTETLRQPERFHSTRDPAGVPVPTGPTQGQLGPGLDTKPAPPTEAEPFPVVHTEQRDRKRSFMNNQAYIAYLVQRSLITLASLYFVSRFDWQGLIEAFARLI